MGRDGAWRLAPAFDVTWAYGRDWTARQRMTVNGGRDDFTVADIRAAGRVAFLKRGRAERIPAEVCDAVGSWGDFADEAGLDPDRARAIASTHRLRLPD